MKFRANLKFFIAACCLPLFAGCEDSKRAKEDLQFVTAAVVRIEALKTDHPSQWSAEEKYTLERYFRTLAFWLQKAEMQNKQMRLAGSPDCGQVLVAQSTWERLSRNCEFDGLYLCPQEMRRYDRLIGLAKKFFPQCRGL